MQKTVLISGASGLVGGTLHSELIADESVQPRQLVRHPVHTESENVFWDPAGGALETEKLEGVSAVVHLAGEPIVAKRWTEEKKRRIRDSRVEGTRLLAEGMGKAEKKPEVLICASGVHWYGARGEEELTEDSEAGQGFLAEVTQEWEVAADAAREAGIRVVHLRFGMVLSPKGGALAKMLPAFRMGLGGPLGDGTGYMSWVALEDVIAILRRALSDSEMRGAYNVTAPRPVTSREFAKTLGKVLHRPAVLPVPGPVIRGVMGEMGETLLLQSVRALPHRLQEEVGYIYAYPELTAALEAMLVD